MKIPLLLLPVLLSVPGFAEEFGAALSGPLADIQKRAVAPETPRGVPAKPVAPAAMRVAKAAVEEWLPADAESKELSKAVRDAGYAIFRRVGFSGELEYKIVTPPGFIDDNSRTFAGVKNLRGFDHYIAWERNGMVIYQDLMQTAKVVTSDGGRRDDFDIVAQVVNGTFANVANTVDNRNRTMRGDGLLGEGLRTVGFADAEAAPILKRVKEMAGEKEFTVPFARRDNVVISLQGRTVRVHPFEDGAAGR